MEANKISTLTQSDIIISTRIRLARNLTGYPFPCRLSETKAQEIAKKVYDALDRYSESFHCKFRDIDMSTVTSEQAISFMENHLISPEFVSTTKTENKKGRHLILSDDNSVAVMVNEEDHIRIQVITDGMNLYEAYSLADKYDTLISETLSYAYDEQLGFLTQCPTNLGTGMRASVMMHLPALTKTGSIPRISASLGKLGLVMRGFNGESSDSKGCLYQLSNQITLGLSEKNAIDNLNTMAKQIITREREAAKEIVKNNDICDQIYRSLGTLKYARLISSEEAMKCLSDVRMGATTGIIAEKLPSTDEFNRLLIDIQPATIIVNDKSKPDALRRDEIRAEILRNTFNLID